VKYLRTLSTARLLVGAIALVAALVASAIAVAASQGSGPTPPPKPLADALHDALSAPQPSGVTARVTFTNNLFPSGALTGSTGSALMSGASGRLWLSDNGGRIELQSDAGDVQIVWNDTKVTVYDASSNTAYVADLPQKQTTSSDHSPPSVDQITQFLADLGGHWTISDAQPTDIAGEPAYSVQVSPKHDGGLLGKAELAWDAVQGVPLRVAIYAQGASAPALALDVTDISFGPVSDSDIAVSPPAGAKIVDLSSQTQDKTGADTPPVTGLAAVQAAAPFAVVAPDTLVGLPRQDVRLVGPADSRSAVVVYGEGLGAIAVVERAQDTTSAGTGKSGTGLDSLPAISLDGITAHELSTELGTVLAWDRGGVSYILAGSVPSAAAEAAARGLK